MEQGIFNLYKKPGETPLECLNRFKQAHPEYANMPMTYAGRLDPLAEGVLIVLGGEARFKREEFTVLDKTYEFEVLWGWSSDTFDVLGMVEVKKDSSEIDLKIEELLPQFRGMLDLKYPHYSSRTVEGVPLWKLAREGTLQNMDMPTKRVNISFLEVGTTRMVKAGELIKFAVEKIKTVQGDFRQEEIIASWKETENANKGKYFPITHFTATVSSGTYIRSLSDELGRAQGCGGLAWSIRRTTVGNYGIEHSLH